MATENANNKWQTSVTFTDLWGRVKRTKKGHIHRGEQVLIPVTRAKIVNAIYDDGVLTGYRVSIDGWYCSLPKDKVECFVAG